MSDKELQEIGIQHGFLDSPTIIAARNKVHDALVSICDEDKIDSGMGFGEFDFWVKINGVEYIIIMKPPMQKDNGSNVGKSNE